MSEEIKKIRGHEEIVRVTKEAKRVAQIASVDSQRTMWQWISDAIIEKGESMGIVIE